MTNKTTHIIPNRWTGEPLVTAEIECDEGTPHSVRLGLAVRWAIKNKISLRNANLGNANLGNADLGNAYLRNANLRNANLWSANLGNADLWNADLWNANLGNADLWNADLRNANLGNADLGNADLRNANLWSARLGSVHGVNDYIKTLHLEKWSISYTSHVIQIGCERHSIDEWREFDDARISRMDRTHALNFWQKYKGHVFATIELSPAKPTRQDEAAE